MSQLIAHVDLNDKLLKFYMKYHRFCNKQQIFELLEKLKANLRIQEEVKEREFERYKIKVKKLQQISKDVQVPFRTVFLTKEEVLKHPGFQFLIKNINFKAANKIYQAHTVFEMYHNLVKFDAKAFEYIDPEFLNNFQGTMHEYDIYTIAKFINLLQHYKDMGLNEKEARQLLYEASEALNSKDFSAITKRDIVAIIIPLKKIGVPVDAQLLFRLEPYILKYIKELTPNQLSEIYLTYLTFCRGSREFMQFIITSVIINLKRIDLSYTKAISTLSNTMFAKRKDLQLEDLSRSAAQELMKKVQNWHFRDDELLQIIRAFIRNGVANENYYEIISVELMKRIAELEPNIFMEIYTLLAVSDIDSQTLVYSCNKKISEALDEVQDSTKEEVAGLLESSEPAEENKFQGILPPDMKLNRYEKLYATQFIRVLRSLWAYSFMAIKRKEWQLVDLDLWNRGIQLINIMIKKLKGFNGLIPFSHKDMELLYQMNCFSTIHGKHSLTIDINQLNEVNLQYKDLVHGMHPLPWKIKLFWLERNYFMKKYRPAITKYKNVKDYQSQIVLENKSQNSLTNIFINDSSDFLGYYNVSEVRSKGYLRVRRHFLDELQIPFVEVSYDQFIKDLSQLKNMKGSYFEHVLGKQTDLPKIGELNETESTKLENIWESIQEIRRKIPETSLSFEEELRNLEVTQKKEVEEFLTEGKQETEDKYIEEEDIYRDSESEDEQEKKGVSA